MKLAEMAVAFKNKGVIGFDLAGGEYKHPAKDHKEAFDLALHNNLNITIHAVKLMVRKASIRHYTIAEPIELVMEHGWWKMETC